MRREQGDFDHESAAERGGGREVEPPSVTNSCGCKKSCCHSKTEPQPGQRDEPALGAERGFVGRMKQHGITHVAPGRVSGGPGWRFSQTFNPSDSQPRMTVAGRVGALLSCTPARALAARP